MNDLLEKEAPIKPPAPEAQVASNGEGDKGPPTLTVSGSGEDPEFVTSDEERKSAVESVQKFLRSLLPK